MPPRPAQSFNIPKSAEGLRAYLAILHKDRDGSPKLNGVHPDSEGVSLATLVRKLADPTRLGTRLDGLAFVAGKREAVVKAAHHLHNQFKPRKTDQERGEALVFDKTGILVKLFESLGAPPTPELVATNARELAATTEALEVYKDLFEEMRAICKRWEDDIAAVATSGSNDQYAAFEKKLLEHGAYLYINTPAWLLSDEVANQQSKPLTVSNAVTELEVGIKRYDNLIAQIENAQGLIKDISGAALSLPQVGEGTGAHKA